MQERVELIDGGGGGPSVYSCDNLIPKHLPLIEGELSHSVRLPNKEMLIC